MPLEDNSNNIFFDLESYSSEVKEEDKFSWLSNQLQEAHM